jgi:chromosome segregation ATPase
MTLFGYDREQVDALVHDGYQKMAMLEQQRNEALVANQTLRREKKRLRAQLEAARGDTKKAKREVLRARQTLEERNSELAAVKDQVEELQAKFARGTDELEAADAELKRVVQEIERLHDDLDRERDRAQARAALITRERDDAWERGEDLDIRLGELAAEKRASEMQVAEMTGVAKAWAPLVLGLSSESPDEGEQPTEEVRKQAMRQHAATIRLKKPDVSPAARLKLLESAKRLGVLPDELKSELRALRGTTP